jgi:hypothetical protein
MQSPLRYPFDAMCYVLAFHPFAWGLQFHHHNLNERAKADARTQWFLRIGCFTFSFRRML